MLNKNIFGEVPDVVHEAVLNTLDSLEKGSKSDKNAISVSAKSKKNRKRGTFRMPRVAVACLACFLISGITVSAMGAINRYRQRMEEMNEQLLDEYYSIAMNGEVTEFSRTLTIEEENRYEKLEEEYINNGLFPKEQITYLQNGDAYSGEGLALDPANRTLYLPEETLRDEEILEIIDFNHKIVYSVDEQNERLENNAEWMSRMEAMDDQMVDEIYLTMFSGKSEISGAYSRMLSENENSRYMKLRTSYEKEGLYASSELATIQTPEEYTGEGIAICVMDSMFYFPESELTDEELLQLIDFEHKASYCIERIGEEVELGLRAGYPKP